MRVWIAVLAVLTSQLAASADPAPAAQARVLPGSSPPVLVQVLPLAPDRPPGFPPQLNEGPARLCKLGTSCLALDARPFEACLVGTRRCPDKMATVSVVLREARVPR
jgi:hypothetical protein